MNNKGLLGLFAKAITLLIILGILTVFIINGIMTRASDGRETGIITTPTREAMILELEEYHNHQEIIMQQKEYYQQQLIGERT